MSMKGCRPLTDDEIDQIIKFLEFDSRKYPFRDTAMILLQIGTGFRIAGLLSIKVGDVYDVEKKKVLSEVTLARMNNKGKKESHTVPIPDNCLPYLERYFKVWEQYFKQDLNAKDPLFPSERKMEGELVPMSQRHARSYYERAVDYCGLKGKVSTHSARKTLADRMMKATNGDIIAVSTALGHKNINSTMAYIKKDTEKVKNLMQSFGQTSIKDSKTEKKN